MQKLLKPFVYFLLITPILQNTHPWCQEGDQEPQSGFFFNDLLVSDQPRSTANQRPVSGSRDHSQQMRGQQSDAQHTERGHNTPNFLIGSEVNTPVINTSDPVAHSEADLESLLDVDIPQQGRNQDSVPHQESFITEVEEFTAAGDDEDDITELCGSPVETIDTPDSDNNLNSDKITNSDHILNNDNIISIDVQLEAGEYFAMKWNDNIMDKR